MKRGCVVIGFGLALFVGGCISAERKAEYKAWQDSDDGIRTVMLDEFESKYQQGWRERAEQKKQERLAREEAARVLANRQAEYSRWLASDDKVDRVSLETFESKYKEGWEERAAQKKQARLEREERGRLAAELRQKRNEVRDSIVSEELKAIRKSYAEGKKFAHAYCARLLLEKIWKEAEDPTVGYTSTKDELYKLKLKSPDCLKEWVSPRLGISETDKLSGEALLAEFGNKFLPNAYANYEKVKDVAVELQQIFNEEFSEPWTIKSTSPKWNSFNKALEKFAKARTEYFMCHDELCHYWMRYRFGVLAAEDFAQIDSRPLAVRLLPENVSRAGYTMIKRQELKEKDAAFVAKYAPESYALYQRLEQDWNQINALINEVDKQLIILDCVRFDRAYYNAQFKRNDLVREMNALVSDFQTWHIDHRTMERSSEEISKIDLERAKGLKTLVDSFPTYVKDRTLGRIIPDSEMVLLPAGTKSTKERVQEERGHYNRKGRWKSDGVEWVDKIVRHEIVATRVQRTEVTQMQWMLVMGTNPSECVRPDGPVENVTWDDCQTFIKKLSKMDRISYRLPKGFEWEYACRAGSMGDWGRRKNGEEGPLEAIGWCLELYHRRRAVALKEANAWGLYDMQGNVSEWCEDSDYDSDSKRMCRGGGSCKAGDWEFVYRDRCSRDIGFRLACPSK